MSKGILLFILGFIIGIFFIIILALAYASGNDGKLEAYDYKELTEEDKENLKEDYENAESR